MIKSIAAVFSGLLLAAVPVTAQTAAELLQKGIYAQETEGNLDNAILIYRQIVNSAPAQRDIAAQAQYRLAEALLQKGDLATASKEFERLARDYADYSNLVSSLSQKYYARAGEIRVSLPGGRGGRGPAGPQAAGDILPLQQARLAEVQARLAELRTKNTPGDQAILERQIEDLKKGIAAQLAGGQAALEAGLTAQSQALFASGFDPSKPISVTGKVSQVIWINPRAWLKVDSAGGTYTFVLAAPNTLVSTGKITRATLRVEMDVTVTGILAKDGSHTARADTISSEGNLIFDRATLAGQ